MLTTFTFDVVNANAASSTLTGGAAALPRTAAGFVNGVEFALRKQGLTLGKNKRILVGIENYDLHARGDAAIVPKAVLWRPWKAKGNYETPILPELKASYTLHLAVLSDDASASDDISALGQAIPTLPNTFSGGSVLPTRIRPDGPRKPFSISPGADLDEWLQCRRRVSFLIHRPDLLIEQRQDSDRDELDTLLRLLSLHRELNDKGEQVWVRSMPGWLVPLEVGFAGVHEPVYGRPGSRDANAPCVVATSLLSLGEFVYGNRLLDRTEPYLALWHATSDPKSKLYFLNSQYI